MLTSTFKMGTFGESLVPTGTFFIDQPAGMFSIEPPAGRDDNRPTAGDEVDAQHAWSEGVVTFRVLRTSVYRKSPGSLLRCQPSATAVFFFKESSWSFCFYQTNETKVTVRKSSCNAPLAGIDFFPLRDSLYSETAGFSTSESLKVSRNFRRGNWRAT